MKRYLKTILTALIFFVLIADTIPIQAFATSATTTCNSLSSSDSFTWISFTTIEDTTSNCLFYLRNYNQPQQKSLTYYLNGAKNTTCANSITIFHPPNYTNYSTWKNVYGIWTGEWNFNQGFFTDFNGGCPSNSSSGGIPISNSASAYINFIAQSNGQIISANGKDVFNLVPGSGGNIYSTGGSCSTMYDLNINPNKVSPTPSISGSNNLFAYVITYGGAHAYGSSNSTVNVSTNNLEYVNVNKPLGSTKTILSNTNVTQTGASCSSTSGAVEGIEIPVLIAGSASNAANLSNQNPAIGGAQSSGSTTPTCGISGGALEWVFCAIFNSISGITNTILNDLIVPQLQITPVSFASCPTQPSNSTPKTPPPACDPTYTLWSAFRIYANLFLVIILLVVVISESVGGGLIDAYSVKKILPKLVISAILINLSIYIVAAAIDIGNILGKGMILLITSPISSHGLLTVSGNSGGGKLATGLLVVGAGFLAFKHLSGLFAKSGGSMLITGVVVPILLVLLAILFTVVLRRIIIEALIIISPIAFVLYILPNTEKTFKKWWHTLLEMILVYPIIMAMFGLSTVMEVISSGQANSPTSSTISAATDTIITLVFTVLPLILIPFSFKIAGDTIGKIAGVVDSQRSKVHKMGENRRKASKEAYKINRIGRKTVARANFSNTKVGQALGKNKYTGRMLNNLNAGAAITQHQAAHHIAESAGGKSIANKSGALAAGTYSSYREAVRGLQEDWGMSATDAESAATTFKKAVGFGAAQQQFAVRQAAIDGTTYRDVFGTDAAGNKILKRSASEQAMRAVARAGNGSTDVRETLSGDVYSISKQVGRPDLSSSFAQNNKLSELYEKQSRGENVGAAIDQEMDKHVMGSFSGAKLGDLAAAKPYAIDSMTSVASKVLTKFAAGEYDLTIPEHRELVEKANQYFEDIGSARAYNPSLETSRKFDEAELEGQRLANIPGLESKLATVSKAQPRIPTPSAGGVMPGTTTTTPTPPSTGPTTPPTP